MAVKAVTAIKSGRNGRTIRGPRNSGSFGVSYWHREAKSSNAEVDFVTVKAGEMVPVEVKSSKKGSMKEIPLYALEHWLTS